MFGQILSRAADSPILYVTPRTIYIQSKSKSAYSRLSPHSFTNELDLNEQGFLMCLTDDDLMAFPTTRTTTIRGLRTRVYANMPNIRSAFSLFLSALDLSSQRVSNDSARLMTRLLSETKEEAFFNRFELKVQDGGILNWAQIKFLSLANRRQRTKDATRSRELF